MMRAGMTLVGRANSAPEREFTPVSVAALRALYRSTRTLGAAQPAKNFLSTRLGALEDFRGWLIRSVA